MGKSRIGSGKGLKFIQEAILSSTDECIMWPFYRMKNGYGQVGTSAGMRLAHRLVCELSKGKPTFDGAQAAHLCGNKACINPRHIRWASQKENEDDKRMHGTWFSRFGGAKLDEDYVLGIRFNHKYGETTKSIAVRTGIPESTIKKIVYRDTWKHIGDEQ